MGVIYKSNRKEAYEVIKKELFGLLHTIGSTVSYEIKQQQQKKIYAHPLPGKYKYTRSHWLQRFTGYKAPTSKGVTVLFSTRKYAAYLEKLVGQRWQTHLRKVDLESDIQKLQMPFNISRRPYSTFIPGFMIGMKKVKTKIKGIKWKLK